MPEQHDPTTEAAAATEGNAEQQQQQPGEATLLVSEFPPPPYYYRQWQQLTPPPIPTEALARGTRRAAVAAAKARAEAERQRLAEGENETDRILGGVQPDAEEEEEGEVVAVFGEIVEDPVLVEPLDACEDPSVVRDEVKRLNRQVLQGFVKLVNDLVHRPLENKYVSCHGPSNLSGLRLSHFVYYCTMSTEKLETNFPITSFSCCKNATSFENIRLAKP